MPGDTLGVALVQGWPRADAEAREARELVTV